MILSKFTTPELLYFEENCNFTEYEYAVFDLRSQDKSLEFIADFLDISIDRVKKLSRKVNKKILRVL
jgi:hypothetical protein